MAPAGFSVLELILCLVLIGIAAQAVVVPLRHQADLVAVRSAREEVVALLARARSEARSHGEATVVIEEGADPYMASGTARAPARVPLADRGVRVEIAGARTSITLRYGPMGVPVFASATLRLVRREAESNLIVSSYGRVRR